MAFTFSGGLDLTKTARAPAGKIKEMPAPDHIVIDFSEDADAHFKPSVAENDVVSRYARIGERMFADDTIPVYSGISGKVASIIKNKDGETVKMIINADNSGGEAEISGYSGHLSELTAENLTEMIKKAAVECRGPHKFAYKKIQAAGGSTKRFILNCCESEPGVFSRKALISEDIDGVLNGAKLLMKALDVRLCEIAIEKESGELLKTLSERVKNDPLFEIRKMKQKYPQDEESVLVFALSGVRIADTTVPEASGFTVFDAETSFAVYRSVVCGIPYCRRVVTVGGENVFCAIGTPAGELLEQCGIDAKTAKTVISGGLLRGTEYQSAEEPVKGGTDAVTVIYEKGKCGIPKMTTCIRCGRCVDVCPSKLLPYRLFELSRKKKYDDCAELCAAGCCECGCCDYVCPAFIPLTKMIAAAKTKISETGERK